MNDPDWHAERQQVHQSKRAEYEAQLEQHHAEMHEHHKRQQQAAWLRGSPSEERFRALLDAAGLSRMYDSSRPITGQVSSFLCVNECHPWLPHDVPTVLITSRSQLYCRRRTSLSFPTSRSASGWTTSRGIWRTMHDSRRSPAATIPLDSQSPPGK